MKIIIKHRWNGTELFQCEAENLGDAVKAAIAARANLSGANLSGADLSRANLYGANLYGANLSGADLYGADLSGADLYGADLSRADLYGADLSRANLYGANLYGANLSGADLSGADLSGADLSGANLSGADLKEIKNAELVIARTRILPEGDLIVWKKCKNEVLVKLLIPKEAKRSSAFRRKCRAEYATVLEIEGAEIAYSLHDNSFEYKVGETVKPKQPFSENWQEECESGIHFYITKIEAQNN